MLSPIPETSVQPDDHVVNLHQDRLADAGVQRGDPEFVDLRSDDRQRDEGFSGVTQTETSTTWFPNHAQQQCDVMQAALISRPKTTESDIQYEWGMHPSKHQIQAPVKQIAVKSNSDQHVPQSAQGSGLKHRGDDRDLSVALLRNQALPIAQNGAEGFQHEASADQHAPYLMSMQASRSASNEKRAKKKSKRSSTRNHNFTNENISRPVSRGKTVPGMDQAEVDQATHSHIHAPDLASMDHDEAQRSHDSHDDRMDYVQHGGWRRVQDESMIRHPHGQQGALRVNERDESAPNTQDMRNQEIRLQQTMMQGAATTAAPFRFAIPQNDPDPAIAQDAQHGSAGKADAARNADLEPDNAEAQHPSRTNSERSGPMPQQHVIQPKKRHGRRQQMRPNAGAVVSAIPEMSAILQVFGMAVEHKIQAASDDRERSTALISHLVSQLEKLSFSEEQSREQNAELMKQRQEAEKQLKSLQSRAAQIDKFVTGLRNDLDKAKSSHDALKTQYADVVAEAAQKSKKLEEVTGVAEHSINDLHKEKQDLFRKLREAYHDLMQKETARANLAQALKGKEEEVVRLTEDRNTIRARLEKLEVNGTGKTNEGKILGGIEELTKLFEGQRSSNNDEKLAELVAEIHQFQTVSPASSVQVQQTIARLGAEIASKIDDLKNKPSTTDEGLATSRAVEQQVREQLDHIKNDVLEWQKWHQQIADLKEEKAGIFEQLKSKTQQITEMTQRLQNAEQDQIALQSNNEQLAEQLRTQTAATVVAIERANEQEIRDQAPSTEELENCRIALESRTKELKSLENTIAEIKMEHTRENAKLQLNLAQEVDRVKKEGKAQVENKILDLQSRFDKTVQAAVQEQVAKTSMSTRRGRLAQNNGDENYAAQIAALRQDHAVEIQNLKNEHMNALANMQITNENAIAQRESEMSQDMVLKTQEAENRLREAHAQDKQDLEQRLRQEVNNAERESEEWKSKFEEVSAMLTEGQAHHNKYSEVQNSFKVPTFTETPRHKNRPRSIDRSAIGWSPAANSMLFEDDVDEDEQLMPIDNDVPTSFQQADPPKQFVSLREVKKQARNARDQDFSRRPHGSDESTLSPELPSSELDAISAQMQDVAAEFAAEEVQQKAPPRANSSQRIVSPAGLSGRHFQAPQATQAAMKAAAGSSTPNAWVGRVPHRPVKTYGRQPVASQQTTSTMGSQSKLVIEDSQEDPRKRAASPFPSQRDPRKARRTVVVPSTPRSSQAKQNAFTQHNDIQRAKSREGLDPNGTLYSSRVPATRPALSTSNAKLIAQTSKFGFAAPPEKSTGTAKSIRRTSSTSTKKPSKADMENTFGRGLALDKTAFRQSTIRQRKGAYDNDLK